MKAELEGFIQEIGSYDTDMLKTVAIELFEENLSLKAYKHQNERTNTEIHIHYNEISKKAEQLEKEVKQLKQQLAAEIDKNAIKNKAIFGSHTEKMYNLVQSANQTEEDMEDEASCENISSGNKNTRDIDSNSYKKEKKGTSTQTTANTGKKRSRKRACLKDSMEQLPQEYVYDLQIEVMNELYGAGNWRVSFWHKHTTLEKITTSYYVKNTYTPVISYGLEHMMETVPYENLLIDKSYVSASLLADILYKKFALGLPFHRQAYDFQLQGIALSKQTLINWANQTCLEFLEVVVEYLERLLENYSYVQSDETYITVNKDGRAAGTKSYMWLHCSSELSDRDPIRLFCYEATRSTDHLRKLFGDFLGYMTSDAYVSYHVFEEENEGVTATGCLMHARRYFAIAFYLNNVASLTDEQLMALPETKALLLIRDIYQEENPLKNLTADERKEKRDINVRPKVDAFFQYVHELNDSEEVFSDRLRKAIQYAVNQEKYLRRFLEDGNIPCDNGLPERVIRSYSLGRVSWLFADTPKGAKVNAYAYSIVETAKANKVNVYIYLKYLFEKLPKQKDRTDETFLKTMMPWSEEYHAYEKQQHEEDLQRYLGFYARPEKPKAPGKRNGTNQKSVEKKSPMIS